jgi:hypothetical protein
VQFMKRGRGTSAIRWVDDGLSDEAYLCGVTVTGVVV